MRTALLILSLLANVLFSFSLARTAGDYERLLVWACAAGNGGHECGEE